MAFPSSRHPAGSEWSAPTSALHRPSLVVSPSSSSICPSSLSLFPSICMQDEAPPSLHPSYDLLPPSGLLLWSSSLVSLSPSPSFRLPALLLVQHFHIHLFCLFRLPLPHRVSRGVEGAAARPKTRHYITCWLSSLTQQLTKLSDFIRES